MTLCHSALSQAAMVNAGGCSFFYFVSADLRSLDLSYWLFQWNELFVTYRARTQNTRVKLAAAESINQNSTKWQICNSIVWELAHIRMWKKRCANRENCWIYLERGASARVYKSTACHCATPHTRVFYELLFMLHLIVGSEWVRGISLLFWRFSMEEAVVRRMTHSSK